MSKQKSNIDLEANERLQQNPFEVENGYFNQLKDNILNAASASESQMEYNLHLKQNKMQVPNGYFQTLTGRILERIDEGYKVKESETQVVVMPKPIPFKWISIAASLLLIASIYFGIHSGTRTSDELAALPDELLIDYLESNLSLGDELITDIAEIDIILDEIYWDETDKLSAALGEHPELEYDFEYYE